MSVDRLQKTLAELVDQGLVELEERWADNGARMSNRYRWVPWELVAPGTPDHHDAQAPTAQNGTPHRSERDPLPAPPAPPTGQAGTPYRCERYKQDSEEQDSEEQDSDEQLIPPLPPHEGGNGLAAVDQDGSMTEVVNVSVVEQPEQPSAIVPVKATKRQAKRPASMPTAEEAARLMAVWNENRPAGWGALTCINQKRWEVALGFAQDLGGLDAFLQALPVALANAGQDRFWGGPGHDWNSFMGYGAKTGKGHFLRFLEQEAPCIPTTNRDGSLTFLGTILQAQNNPTPKFF
jgi:hypothetical protein